ncbi:MAG: hypothetical protein ACTSQD_04055 [Promethearchaeota archaeon]
MGYTPLNSTPIIIIIHDKKHKPNAMYITNIEDKPQLAEKDPSENSIIPMPIPINKTNKDNITVFLVGGEYGKFNTLFYFFNVFFLS